MQTNCVVGDESRLYNETYVTSPLTTVAMQPSKPPAAKNDDLVFNSKTDFFFLECFYLLLSYQKCIMNFQWLYIYKSNTCLQLINGNCVFIWILSESCASFIVTFTWPKGINFTTVWWTNTNICKVVLVTGVQTWCRYACAGTSGLIANDKYSE